MFKSDKLMMEVIYLFFNFFGLIFFSLLIINFYGISDVVIIFW